MGVTRIKKQSHGLSLFPADPSTQADLGIGTWKIGSFEVEVHLYSAERWAILDTQDPVALRFEGGIVGVLRIA